MVQLSGSEALTLLVDRSKPMAAAMPTLPPLDELSLSVGMSLAALGSSAVSCWPTWPWASLLPVSSLGLPFASLLPLSALLPAALASAAALLAPEPWRLSVTPPPAVMKRETEARVVSGAMVMAMAAPTDALPPAATPLAVVLVTPTCVALAVKLPLTTRGAAVGVVLCVVPSEATVVFVGSDRRHGRGDADLAAAGTGLDAGVHHVAGVRRQAEVASPVMTAVSATWASVMAGHQVQREGGTDAHLAAVRGAVGLGEAVRVVLALMLTSPPLSVTAAPGLTMASEVLLSTRFSASEPATPTLPASLAPDMATAPKLLVPSAAPSGPVLVSVACVVPLLLVVIASSVRPLAVIWSFWPTSAVLVVLTTLMAMPTPTWTLLPPPPLPAAVGSTAPPLPLA